MDAKKGLEDSELIKALMTGNRMRLGGAPNHWFQDEVIRQTTTIDFVTHLDIGLGDANSPERCTSYMRSVNRQIRNEFNDHNSRWGMGDTYDHTRRTPQIDRYNGRYRRNYSKGTFPRMNRRNQQMGVNCAVGDEVSGEADNENYYEEGQDNSDYQWGRAQSQVGFKTTAAMLP